MGLRQAPHRLAGNEVFARLNGVGFCIDAIMQRRCFYSAGANGVAANALGHVVCSHAFGEANDGGFGRTINESVWQTTHAGAHAGHIDDAAATLL